MNAGDGYIIRNFDINILLPANINPILMPKSDKLEDLAILLSFFLHNLQNNIRLLRFRNIDCIKFLVIKIYPVLIMSLAHLAKQRFPVNRNTKIINGCFYLFR